MSARRRCWLVDLSAGRNRLGGSALAQVYGELGDDAAGSRRSAAARRSFAAVLAELRARRTSLLAYHDRSDGGLFATLVEMAFAGHCGLDIALPAARGSALAQLFAEELGVVIQVQCRR